MGIFYPGTLTSEVSEREIKGREVSRKAAAEGIVLLENDGVLPLKEGSRVALYGIGAGYTIKGGTGSGDVNSRDTVTVRKGLENAGFDIVNKDYLDAFDREYKVAYKEWVDKIYEMAGDDQAKLYDAHSRLKMRMPIAGKIDARSHEKADAAIYVISRISGEGADRRAVKGDYYLSDEEEEELSCITKQYEKTIVLLNIGGVMDLSFMDKYKISALLLISQGGCEAGNAAADVLCGRVNPSGRLTDTYAFKYGDYPSSEGFGANNGNLLEEYYNDGIYVGYRYFDTFGIRVRYPFGYGLSYTTFETEYLDTKVAGGKVTVRVKVKNTGAFAGKKVVFLFASCPAAEQQKEYKRLVAFNKTKLLGTSESEEISLTFSLDLLSSYRTAKAAYYMEKGEYILALAENADKINAVSALTLSETVCTEKLTNVCELFDRMHEIAPKERREKVRNEMRAKLLEGIDRVDIDIEVKNLAEGRCKADSNAGLDKEVLNKADEILKSLTTEEKVMLVCGAPSALAAEVIGSAAGKVPGAAGETVGIKEKGVPGVVLADGPAGVRIQQRYQSRPDTGEIIRLTRYQSLENRFFGKVPEIEGGVDHFQFATAIPIGTCLAQSFDTGLLCEVGKMVAEDLRFFKISCWLAPGLNIHRNPLCGRNFEYYSEDPLVSGLMAAAITKGVQEKGDLAVTIKHFACNNQEENRFHVNSNVSERALREIYLKGFEIAVKEGNPGCIMTSYNRLNGVHTANSKDLCSVVARDEWGFSGLIMTDWGTTNTPGSSYASKCILAGNDLIMPGTAGDREEIADALLDKQNVHLPIEKLDESVKRVLYFALKTEQ